MKKFLLLSISATAVMLLDSGCSSAPEKPAPPVLGAFSAENEKTAMTVAQNFASAFEKALVSGDFNHLKPVFPPGTKQQMSEGYFQKMRRTMLNFYGTPQKLAYITFLNQGKLRDYLWKISFLKPGKEKNSPPESREIILSVRIFCEAGKSPAVAGFFFQRF